VIYFTVNNDKKNYEHCRVVKLLKIKWLRHVSGMEEIKKTYSIVNKIEHQIPLKINNRINTLKNMSSDLGYEEILHPLYNSQFRNRRTFLKLDF